MSMPTNVDRPYIGWKDDDGPRHKAFRCMVRVKFNPGLPYNFTIMKHTGWIATERSVKAHETRADGRALAAETGYQASYRYGSHQSITRNWMMPMHQTDTLFHKKTGGMGFTCSASTWTITRSTRCRKRHLCASPKPRTAVSVARVFGNRHNWR